MSSQSKLAPIALFAYCRANHLARTVAALRANPEAKNSRLYVFSDAARDAASAEGVQQVREYLECIEGFARVNLIVRSQNFGLSRNITEGVSAVLAEHDAVIVVEDDVLVSPFFLSFMNDALALYSDKDRVGSISGFAFPIEASEPFFLRGADCWGWATWRERWRYYNPDGGELLAQLNERGLTHAFDLEGAMAYTQMLKDQIVGHNDSWAVRWHASCFLRDLLILYPGKTLVKNIGNDGSGTHANIVDDSYTSEFSPEPVKLRAIPIAQDVAKRQAIREFLLKRQVPKAANTNPQRSDPSLVRLLARAFKRRAVRLDRP